MTQFTKHTTTRFTIAMTLVIGVGVAQAEVPVVQAPEVDVKFGEVFTYKIEADGALGYSVEGLPFWLTREKNLLRGAAIKSGKHSLTIYALNRDGISEAFESTIIVEASAKAD